MWGRVRLRAAKISNNKKKIKKKNYTFKIYLVCNLFIFDEQVFVSIYTSSVRFILGLLKYM